MYPIEAYGTRDYMKTFKDSYNDNLHEVVYICFAFAFQMSCKYNEGEERHECF